MPFSPPAAPPPLPPPHSSEVDLRRCRRLFLLLTLQLQLHLRPSGARGRPSHAPARCSVRLSPQARRQWHRFTSSLDVAMNSVAVLGDGEGEITCIATSVFACLLIRQPPLSPSRGTEGILDGGHWPCSKGRG
uniref:Uncharacterized protein n=1 Tax=Oryza sativa subsp. japonica TaxID=39947 RepID=Q5YM03_ORYSJ|nr:hypothetical protein [Oryza sativa Japonica Group]BAD62511.1 hypothetical protein [Oryza sativa Japonica Group]